MHSFLHASLRIAGMQARVYMEYVLNAYVLYYCTTGLCTELPALQCGQAMCYAMQCHFTASLLLIISITMPSGRYI